MMRQTLDAGLPELGLDLPESARQTLCDFGAAVIKQNEVMNLTAITDDEGVAEKHFADSLLPLTMVQLPVGASLVDVGSGAGFPGLPMALARPDLRVTFLDSLQKRLTFLAQLTQMLGVPAAMLHALSLIHI